MNIVPPSPVNGSPRTLQEPPRELFQSDSTTNSNSSKQPVNLETENENPTSQVLINRTISPSSDVQNNQVDHSSICSNDSNVLSIPTPDEAASSCSNIGFEVIFQTISVVLFSTLSLMVLEKIEWVISLNVLLNYLILLMDYMVLMARLLMTNTGMNLLKFIQFGSLSKSLLVYHQDNPSLCHTRYF